MLQGSETNKLSFNIFLVSCISLLECIKNYRKGDSKLIENKFVNDYVNNHLILRCVLWKLLASMLLMKQSNISK